MNKNGTKLYKQGQLNGYTYCIRQIFEENTLGYSHGSSNATKLNNKCHGFSSEEQNGKLGAPVPARLYASPSLVDGPPHVGGRKEQRRQRRAAVSLPSEGKLRFADRLRALLKRENHQPGGVPQDPYDFSEAPPSSVVVAAAATTATHPQQTVPISVAASASPPTASEVHRTVENGSLGRHGGEPLLNHRAQSKPVVVHKEIQPVQPIQRLPVVSQPLSSVSFAKGTTVFGLAEVKPKVVAASGGTAAAVCSATGTSATPGGMAKQPKTMNRLQAKIAQNRVLDKLKRAQQDSGHTSSTSSHNHRVTVSSASSSTSSSLLAGAAFVHDRHEVAKPGVLARPRERLGRDRRVRVAPVTVAPTATTTSLATSPAAALRNLRRFWNAEKNTGADEAQASTSGTGGYGTCHSLPGMGSQVGADLDSSASDSSEDEDSGGERAPSLWNWDLDCSDASTVRSVRSLRISRLRAELRKRYEVLCKRQAAARPSLERQDALVRHLARAAKLCPDAAAQVLMGSSAASARPKPTAVEKRTCCYQDESVPCTQPALPYTRHCTKHIMYNIDQLLFEHCTAKFADNTQCCVPVFDMCHELPLCPEHAKKRDNYNKMASEPKPKKPRKKSKPPALTRPPKRGKKKKAAPLGMASPPPTPHSPSSSSFSSCMPLEVLVQSPASSSSSSSPCSSRSPPFLGGSDSSSGLLGNLVASGTTTLSSGQVPALTPPAAVTTPQPLLQTVVPVGCATAVRIKTEPKSPPMVHQQQLHHSLPSSSSSALTMPVLTSHPLQRSTATTSHAPVTVAAAVAATPHVLTTTRAMAVHHPPLPMVAVPTTANHLANTPAGVLPAVTHQSSSSHLVTSGAMVARPAAASHPHLMAQTTVAVPHSSVVTMEAPAAAVVGALGGTSMADSYGYVPVVTAGSIGTETVAKELVERIEPDLASDLENQFSPDTIEKSLELPLDAAELANQATKLLEEHDFTEVLNKISDDAFSDFFAEAKNGEYVPSKEETEELERALAAVSKDVHMARESLAKLSAAGVGQGEVPDLPDLVDAFPDLPLSTSDINSLTQALMGGEALRTVALLSSADQGFALLEQPAFASQQQQAVAATSGDAPPAVAAASGGWLLGTADFTSSSPAVAPEVPTQGSSAAVLPKRSVLAQESVS
uniref:Putative ino80 complex subunit d n=1 Tax=Amblyomma aureolatum TaxID=187763 RepID=A0A1E1XD43_9ACAR